MIHDSLHLPLQNPNDSIPWLGLMIGNSRLHWFGFSGDDCYLWHSSHVTPEQARHLIQHAFHPNAWTELAVEPQEMPTMFWQALPAAMTLDLWLASVVPAQTRLWQTFPHLHEITLRDIPLKNLYATMGSDRALAVWGAGVRYGFPVLVIDAGTALTFTGCDSTQTLVGGAILPGLGLQFQSLGQRTAALPHLILPSALPDRWATNTPNAIQSGILYTVLAGFQSFLGDWWTKFPGSAIALTGGDALNLYRYLQAWDADLADKIIVDPDLIAWGMRSLHLLSSV